MMKKAILFVILALLFELNLFAQKPVSDLRDFFGIADFAIIGDQVEINLDKSAYPLSSQSFIVLDYMLEEKHVSKKIGYRGQSVFIEKDKLFIVDSVRFPGKTLPQVKVYYHNQVEMQTDFITRVNLNFIDAPKVKREFELMRNLLRQNGKDNAYISKFIFDYFTEIYGETSETHLSALIDTVLKEQ